MNSDGIKPAQAAHHAAGHLVVAVLGGFTFEPIELSTVINTTGCAFANDTLGNEFGRLMRPVAPQRLAVALLAGDVAEELLGQSRLPGSTTDWFAALDVVTRYVGPARGARDPQDPAHAERCFRRQEQAVGLVHIYNKEIEHIAGLLLEGQEVSTAQVVEVLADKPGMVMGRRWSPPAATSCSTTAPRTRRSRRSTEGG